MFSEGRERVHWEQMGQNILKDWLQLINENDYHTKITIWTNLLYIHAILIKSIGPFLSVFPEEGVVRGKAREIKVISYSQPKHNTKETYSSRKPFERHFFTTLGHSGTLTLRIFVPSIKNVSNSLTHLLISIFNVPQLFNSFFYE